MGGAQVLGINLEGAGMGGAQGVAPAGLQQAIASILQGAMFQQQQQRSPAAPAPAAAPTLPPLPTPASADQQQQRPTAFVAPSITVQLQSPAAEASASQQQPTPTSNMGVGTPPTPSPAAQQGQTLQSLMGSLQGQPSGRPRDILLHCHSPHFNRPSPAPPRPSGLIQFLSQEVQGHRAEDSLGTTNEYFDMLFGFSQLLNTVHPAIMQYIQGNILRGRDINNPQHVLTGVRSYGRRFGDWVVVSVRNYSTYCVEMIMRCCVDAVSLLFVNVNT
jgi:hypothetical protein